MAGRGFRRGRGRGLDLRRHLQHFTIGPNGIVFNADFDPEAPEVPRGPQRGEQGPVPLNPDLSIYADADQDGQNQTRSEGQSQNPPVPVQPRGPQRREHRPAPLNPDHLIFADADQDGQNQTRSEDQRQNPPMAVPAVAQSQSQTSNEELASALEQFTEDLQRQYGHNPEPSRPPRPSSSRPQGRSAAEFLGAMPDAHEIINACVNDPDEPFTFRVGMDSPAITRVRTEQGYDFVINYEPEIVENSSMVDVPEGEAFTPELRRAAVPGQRPEERGQGFFTLGDYADDDLMLDSDGNPITASNSNNSTGFVGLPPLPGYEDYLRAEFPYLYPRGN